MIGCWSPVPPPGPVRTMALATFANTVGSGLWGAGVALFLTRAVGLSAAEVGLGLTVAGLVGLLASVPVGHLADRRDPRAVRALVQVGQGTVAAAYLLVSSFPGFVAVAVLEALLLAGNLSVRAALVAAVAGPGERVRTFATLRGVASAGMGVGAALAAVALALDTRPAYLALAAGNALTYFVSAALLMRLPAYPPTPEARRAPVWTALRDRPFLAVGAASAVLSVHLVVLHVLVPLWVVGHTQAPPVTVSVVLVTNTVLTVLLAVRVSRRVRDAPSAARAMRRGGLLLGAAMLLFAATAGRPAAVAVAVLLIAVGVHTVGDLHQANAAAGLAYDLAEPAAFGQYQGAAGLLNGLAQAAAPALLTLLVLEGGPAGWAALAAVLALGGAVTPPLTRRALGRHKGGPYRVYEA